MGRNARTCAGKNTDEGADLANQGKEVIAAVRYKAKANQAREKRRYGFFACFGKKQTILEQKHAGSIVEDDESSDGKQLSGKVATRFDMPETFVEMVKLNAAMTGANVTYISIVLDEFG